MATVLERLNEEAASVVDKVRESLVEVHSGQGAFGSGVICHPDGLIVTNAHVVHSRQPSVRLWDGRTLPARIIALDRERDLAALVIRAEGLRPIELGDSAALRPGEWVLSVGHPWGIAGAATAGAVIGTEAGPQPLAYGGAPLVSQGGPPVSQGRDEERWLVANLPLRPGHSGGPMVDSAGRLVGINTMITGPEIGMAVPVAAVKAFLREAVAPRVAHA